MEKITKFAVDLDKLEEQLTEELEEIAISYDCTFNYMCYSNDAA